MSLLPPQEVLSAPDRSLAQQPGYLARLGAFTGAARVKRLALKLMVAAAASTGAVDSAQLQRLKKLFQEMDLDGDGIISGQQLAAGLAQLGTTLTDKDLAEFLQVSQVGAGSRVCRRALVHVGSTTHGAGGCKLASNCLQVCLSRASVLLNVLCVPWLCKQGELCT
jgi:hypothetical protein